MSPRGTTPPSRRSARASAPPPGRAPLPSAAWGPCFQARRVAARGRERVHLDRLDRPGVAEREQEELEDRPGPPCADERAAAVVGDDLRAAVDESAERRSMRVPDVP